MYNKENDQEAKEIFARLSSEMERQGRKQAELVEYLNLPRGTYTNWKLGKSRNFCEHLGGISEFLSIDIGWLVTGEIRSADIEDEREKELLELFRKLSEEKQNVILQNIKYRYLCDASMFKTGIFKMQGTPPTPHNPPHLRSHCLVHNKFTQIPRQNCKNQHLPLANSPKNNYNKSIPISGKFIIFRCIWAIKLTA